MSSKRQPRGGCALRRSVAEPQLFARFYEQHADAVLRFLVRRTLDVDAARDLTAETFAQAFRARGSFRGSTEEEAAGWLFGIARNLLRHYVRSGVVERRAVEKLGMRIPPLEPDDYARIEELAGLAQAREVVAAEFGRLNGDQREAVRLRIVDQLPYREVAQRLAVSEQTARARVSRGLRHLAAAIDETPNVRETMT
jgi:RNA polymerase sigma-70 factor, ECF subfamily